MIKVIIMGGLGNQMFQYAAAFALGQRLNVPVKAYSGLMDKNKKTRRTYRPYLLDIFESDIQTDSSLITAIGVRLWYILNQYPSLRNFAARHLLPGGGFKDRYTYNFDPRFFSLQDPITLCGYYQSEQYFSPYRDRILRLYQFPATEGWLKELEAKIRSTESVSVHIRRGDYLTTKGFSDNFTILDLPYYEKGMEILRRKVKQPTFFIFSDDPQWCEQQFGHLTDCTVIDSQNEPDYRDMQLMAACRHNIIANSSFSWWGAWLNPNEDKTVIAPKYWYKDPARAPLAKGIKPSAWIEI